MQDLGLFWRAWIILQELLCIAQEAGDGIPILDEKAACIIRKMCTSQGHLMMQVYTGKTSLCRTLSHFVDTYKTHRLVITVFNEKQFFKRLV